MNKNAKLGFNLLVVQVIIYTLLGVVAIFNLPELKAIGIAVVIVEVISLLLGLLGKKGKKFAAYLLILISVAGAPLGFIGGVLMILSPKDNNQSSNQETKGNKNRHAKGNDVYYLKDEKMFEECIGTSNQIFYVGEGTYKNGQYVYEGEGKQFNPENGNIYNGRFLDLGVSDGVCRLILKMDDGAICFAYAKMFENNNPNSKLTAKPMRHRFELFFYPTDDDASITIFDDLGQKEIEKIDVSKKGIEVLKKNYETYLRIAKESGATHNKFQRRDANPNNGSDEIYSAGQYDQYGNLSWGFRERIKVTYVGEFDNNVPCGWGFSIFENGTYVGEGNSKGRNGFGVYRFQNGDEYIGTWQDGKMHGWGIFFFNDDEFYVGDFTNDARDGLGNYYFADGAYYCGQWVNNKREGKGKFVFPDGKEQIGRFSNDKFLG